MLVFGTRPEAIKMCPLVKEFQKYPDDFETIVCVTDHDLIVMSVFQMEQDSSERDYRRKTLNSYQLIVCS